MRNNKQKLKALLCCTLVSAIMLLLPAAALAEIAIIVNNSNNLSSITAEQATALWLGKTKSVGDSEILKPIDLPEGNAIREEFYKKVANKNPTQLKVYWRKQVFTGRAFPPDTVDNTDEVKKWVSANSNGVGYIDAASVDSSVKVLLKID